MLLWMYWRQFYPWGELNRLINKCSTFMFFDLIGKCGRQTNRQGLQRSYGNYRESNTTVRLCLRLCKGPYMWAHRNTLTCTPMSCKGVRVSVLTVLTLWAESCYARWFVMHADDPRRQEHKQNTAIGRTWFVRLCTMIREDKNINKTLPLEERDWFVSQFVQ